MTSTETAANSTTTWIQEMREKIYKETQGMSHQEFNEYILHGGESFRDAMKKCRQQKTENKNID